MTRKKCTNCSFPERVDQSWPTLASSTKSYEHVLHWEVHFVCGNRRLHLKAASRPRSIVQYAPDSPQKPRPTDMIHSWMFGPQAFTRDKNSARKIGPALSSRMCCLDQNSMCIVCRNLHPRLQAQASTSTSLRGPNHSAHSLQL